MKNNLKQEKLLFDTIQQIYYSIPNSTYQRVISLLKVQIYTKSVKAGSIGMQFSGAKASLSRLSSAARSMASTPIFVIALYRSGSFNASGSTEHPPFPKTVPASTRHRKGQTAAHNDLLPMDILRQTGRFRLSVYSFRKNRQAQHGFLS